MIKMFDQIFHYDIFCTAGKELEDLEISIRQGLYIKGTLNIFGFNIHGEIEVVEGVFKADISLDPLDILGGMIQVRKSKDETEEGPFCHVEISKEGTAVSETFIHIGKMICIFL